MAGKLPFEKGASINKPPLFCGLNYKYGEARMKFFVESIDKGIWDAIENGHFIPKIQKSGSFIKKLLSQWTNEESAKAKFDCIAKNIITSALDSKEFFRISECEFAKEMWDTLKATHSTEIKKAKTKSQARRKMRQNQEGLNQCFMAKKEDDASNVSSSTSSNAENYNRLLQAFQETHEEAN